MNILSVSRNLVEDLPRMSRQCHGNLWGVLEKEEKGFRSHTQRNDFGIMEKDVTQSNKQRNCVRMYCLSFELVGQMRVRKRDEALITWFWVGGTRASKDAKRFCTIRKLLLHKHTPQIFHWLPIKKPKKKKKGAVCTITLITGERFCGTDIKLF